LSYPAYFSEPLCDLLCNNAVLYCRCVCYLRGGHCYGPRCRLASHDHHNHHRASGHRGQCDDKRDGLHSVAREWCGVKHVANTSANAPANTSANTSANATAQHVLEEGEEREEGEEGEEGEEREEGEEAGEGEKE
jgi:hypothetical protein